MARVEINETVQKDGGSGLLPGAGVSVYVYLSDTTTPATVYVAETGSTTRSQPLTTDAEGRIEGWVEEGSYDLAVQASSGVLAYTQPWEADISGRGFQDSPVVASGYTYRDGNKDGFNYIKNFDDLSTPAAGPLAYFSAWGAYGTKESTGSLNLFWGSVQHKGTGEAGIFIGDITANAAGSGGNIWGFDLVLTDNKNAQMYGGRIVLNSSVARTTHASLGLQITNQNDAIQLDHGLHVAGNWNRPIICYSNAAGTTIVFDVDSAGAVRTGQITPLANSTSDLGTSALRWRAIRGNSLELNNADGGGGAGNIAMHNTAIAPPNTPANGGVIYIESGTLKYKGSSGTVTVVAPA